MRAAPLAAGSRLADGYEVIEHLSRGRRLDVYDAWSEERACRCVVKAVRPDRAGDAEVRRALLREGELLSGLSHPHIVRGYETIERPIPMVVMETLPGQTLEYLIEETPEPPSSEALAQLGLHLGSAIRYMHRRGFCHLDLKPANVIADRGLAKLIDLSVARPPGRCPPGLGTWCYMAPEQALGERVGPAADVWGIGTVLFEAATGSAAFDEPAYEGPATSADGSAGEDPPYPQLERAAPRLDDVREGLAPELVELVAACLRRAPRDRPTMDELLGALGPRLAEPARRGGARP